MFSVHLYVVTHPCPHTRSHVHIFIIFQIVPHILSLPCDLVSKYTDERDEQRRADLHELGTKVLHAGESDAQALIALGERKDDDESASLLQWCGSAHQQLQAKLGLPRTQTTMPQQNTQQQQRRINEEYEAKPKERTKAMAMSSRQARTKVKAKNKQSVERVNSFVARINLD
jgi:4-hydroxy-3-methylbut-2-enyl diphosphate reductase IspH